MLTYVLSIFVASAQLLLVQPTLAKRLLPLLGGTPAVWTTCMLFYQTLLLAGYAYAHVLTEWLPPRRQLVVHSLLMLLALVVFASGLPVWQPPDEKNAVGWILGYLAFSIGAPFFVLSANAPLVQRWYTYAGKGGEHVYKLYAASNLGSLIGLGAYPALVEPALTLNQQYVLLQALYGIFLLLNFGVIWQTYRIKNFDLGISENSKIPEERLAPQAPPAPASKSSTWKEREKWIFLAFVPSSLLLSFTSYVTSNVAPCPLFWIVPLSFYLGTFIIAFSGRQFVPLKALLVMQTILLGTVSVVFYWNKVEFAYSWLFPIHAALFLVIALISHTRLADSAPEPARLTEFYLCLSIGGALGGLFNTLIAPAIFTTTNEYPLLLVLSCLIRPSTTLFGKKPSWRLASYLYAVCLLLIGVVFALTKTLPIEQMQYRTVAILLPAAVVCAFTSFDPFYVFLGYATLFMFGANMWHSDVIYQKRNLFGPLTVSTKLNKFTVLTHGNIIHGAEPLDTPRPREPLTYYHHGSPIGFVFQTLNPQLNGANIAVVGLGAGTLACYGRPDQHWTFYEINPLVGQVARDPSKFTYLADCKAAYDIIEGDARQSITKALDHSFSVIVLDAFSSDAIPTHLLTREALELYLKKLAPHGLIAFHISTKTVALAPVLAKLAAEENLACLDADYGENTIKTMKWESEWLVMTRSKSDLETIAQNREFRTVPLDQSKTIWTDDFSNLLEVLKL